MLRKLLDRLAVWLGYSRREYPRFNMGGDEIARGARWEQFYAETGGMADMILAIRRNYFEASAALGVSDLDKRYEYALADRLARELEREVLSVIETGKIKAMEKTYAEKEAAIRR